MKTDTENKFDKLIKESFHLILSTQGYKKKNLNFYLKDKDVGKVINIQKSQYYSKDHIHFTINIGIFNSKFWNVYYNYYDKKIPDSPSVSDCVIYNRVGHLMNKGDLWFDIKKRTRIKKSIKEMTKILNNFILPYLDKFKCIDDVINEMENEIIKIGCAPMILNAEYGYIERAKSHFDHLLLDSENSKDFKTTVRQFGEKYGFK